MKIKKKKIIDLTKIKDPFLMIDEIRAVKSLKSGIGIKKIEKSAWYLKSHFINNPMMPGSLIQEAMLQTIVSILYSSTKFKKKICLITSLKASYFSKVNKPTTLFVHSKILKITSTKVEASAIVKDYNQKKIASGSFNYFISKT